MGSAVTAMVSAVVVKDSELIPSGTRQAIREGALRPLPLAGGGNHHGISIGESSSTDP
jgi:hypothetical protein